MAFKSSFINVTSSGAQALAAETTQAGGWVKLLIKVSSGVVYLGSSAVTTSGYPMTTGDTPFTITLGPGSGLPYAAVSTAAGINVLKSGDF